MHTRKGLETLATLGILLVLLLTVTAVGLRWVFLVPIYQAPDEPYHLDYALAIYQNGGLFRIQGPPPPGARMVHPYTQYLMDRTATQTVAFHGDVKMPPGYGTPAFTAALDQEHPAIGSAPPPEATGLAWVYPFGYYALLAGWLALLAKLNDSLVFLFFGARILSIGLLMVTLLCVYGTARELGHRRPFSLLLTGVIGLFPLTLFVSSYVQPDNLSFTLVSLCFYLTLVARRLRHRDWVLGLLGLAFGALLVTKPHYYLCTLAPALALLASTRMGTGVQSWLRAAALVLLPSLATGALYLWTIAEASTYYSGTAAHGNLGLFVLHGLHKALQDFYTGTTHRSFWGIFGWMDTPLVIGNATVSAGVHLSIRLGTWTILALTLVRLKQVLGRAAGWYRRGQRRRALRVLAANPVLNSFFLFTVLMIVLYVRLANRFGAQGRNWLPYLLPIFLSGVSYAPKALRRRAHRAAFASVILTFLVIYGVVGNYYAFQTLQGRFYDPHHNEPMDMAPVPVGAGRSIPPSRPVQSAAAPCQVFTLKQPAYVYALRLRYALAVPPSGSLRFRFQWRNQQGGSPSPTTWECSLHWLEQPPEKTLYVWVNETIDEWGVQVEGTESPLILREVIVYRQPPSGSRSVSPLRLVQWRDGH